MARVGLANFQLPSAVPVGVDQVWRENLNREQWDHLYHSLRTQDPKRKYSLKSAQTEQQEKLSKTWHIMGSIYSTAAGQASYHYNQLKPTGNVQAYFPSASFSYVPRKYAREQEELLKNCAYRRAKKDPKAAWAATGNNARFGGGVRSSSQDDPRAFLNAEGHDCRPDRSSVTGEPLPIRGNPMSNHVLYNEAYYNEGLYNSDKQNKHDTKMRGRINATKTAYGVFSVPGKTRSEKWNERFNKWHTNINARSSSYVPSSNRANTSPAPFGPASLAQGLGETSQKFRPSTGGPRSGGTPRQSSGTPREGGKAAMSKTWSNGFRDAHGSENAYRCEPGYDTGAGRFDQIRDNRPTKLWARSSSSSKPMGIGKNLHNNNAYANSDARRFNSEERALQNPKENQQYLDVHGDPNVTNANKRYSHTVSGPFFHPTTNEGTAGGLLVNPTAMANGVARNRASAGSLTRDGAPGRRVNHQSVPTFQRVVGI